MPIRITQNRIIFNDGTEMTTAPQVQSAFPAGTVALFQQMYAPTGWTKNTAFHDYAIRLVNGTASAYSGGLSFSSVFTTRYPSGSVSVSVGNHSSTTTGSSTTGVSVQTNTVGGSFSGTTNNSTISVSGTSGAAVGSSTTSSNSVTISGTTASANNGINSHNHSYTKATGVGTTPTDIWYQSGESYISAITGVTLNTTSANTGDSGSGSGHSHTVSFNGGSHSHDFSVPSHTHAFSTTNDGSHNHSYSGTFTSTAHGHTVNDSGHTHTIPTMSHSASGSFSGNSMDFRINYVDVILATKN